MASAPDRISIKRRRDDDVVNILTLANSKKQRTSEHYFIRVGREHILPSTDSPSTSTNSHQIVRAPPGVPSIGTTRPGDEVKDFQKYKAAQDLRNGVSRSLTHPENTDLSKLPPDARRFHLTRDLSLAHRPQPSATIRKPKSYLRPHLPTFVERLPNVDVEELASHAAPPVDRIIKSVDGINHKLDAQRILADDGTITKEKTPTFQKPKSQSVRTGQSIQDDPATWDLNSDRLADELMILALEMDPDAKAIYHSDPVNNQTIASEASYSDPMLLDGPADYVYETYVRVQQKSISELEDLVQAKNLGYLVIDEEEEDLWEQYLHDDDDDDEDWDEEDGDSNAEDNPRNDYPEDEVSSDDEYGRNIYQYRRDHSDDEQFDREYL